MRILGLSGSARRLSTNTALLRALSRVAPEDVEMTVFDGVGALPVFSPDLESESPPVVRDYIARVEAAEGVLVASPEYVRTLPGGLKNAIDWLVSRDTLVAKPMALVHASARGDAMLGDLARVLATLSARFAPDLVLRFPLMTCTPDAIADFIARPDNAGQTRDFLCRFSRYAREG